MSDSAHARLHNFSDNKLYGMHKYTIFFHHIVIVLVRNYHNMVKKYYIHIYTTIYNCKALHEITDHVHEMLSVCAP